MYGTYESTQYAELPFKGDYEEIEFVVTLKCTAQSTPGQTYGPPEQCWPAEAPEFEVDNIHFRDDDGKLKLLSYGVFERVLGEQANWIIDGAIEDAIDSGEF
jgi:hypothetical protein